MNTPLRLSPIHDLLQPLNGEWREINGMPALMRTEPQPTAVGIADLSFLTRFGVKGANAAAWLANQGLSIPTRPNTWRFLPAGGMIARLGLTEFLVEDSLSSDVSPRLATISYFPPKVYPVLRQDLALGLVGDRVYQLLRQTCSVNFQALSLSDCPVVLTSMVGVAVTVVPGEHQGQPYYRIWCDGTFGAYIWHTLVEIATQLGGGAIGAEPALRQFSVVSLPLSRSGNANEAGI